MLKGEERSSGVGVSTRFINWVEERGLIDLGFAGSKFIWNHGVNMDTRRSARLDRGLCDDNWRCTFSEASIKHLTHSYIDHCPIMLLWMRRRW